MAPFLDVNVQDSRLRHRRRAVFAARDVLLLTVALCKVELFPMLLPVVGRRLFFYRVAILHCPFFSGGVPWCVAQQHYGPTQTAKGSAIVCVARLSPSWGMLGWKTYRGAQDCSRY